MTKGRGDLNTGRWKRIRKRILERDGHECQIGLPGCRREAGTVDHIVPHALGGGDEPSNLRAACRPCNSALAKNARGSTPPASFSTGVTPFAPPAFLSLAAPAQSPVKRRTHRQVPG